MGHQNRRERGVVNQISFVSIHVALQESFFTLSIVFLPNFLYLSSDLALLFHDSLGEHCRELGFRDDVLARLRSGDLQGLGAP